MCLPSLRLAWFVPLVLWPTSTVDTPYGARERCMDIDTNIPSGQDVAYGLTRLSDKGDGLSGSSEIR